jgi:hypothetical protein
VGVVGSGRRRMTRLCVAVSDPLTPSEAESFEGSFLACDWDQAVLSELSVGAE